ncbi:hypothetical protein AGDE_13322 [Angomonas deanei]|uniref:Uncharacterized protein n=1 Tax=Angomonas deanei TaxID=59799 RepID=A0A7G2CEG8_9TRYP|nr:hypothetical protein AGDE_13322 [Angomonas deanei]CAD2218260.1 hypothetical protein, conserved [Angomonas deanei]|eukprot:EPY22456.1 hypothetical protein AGDE_13322 [Angomonas deanei]
MISSDQQRKAATGTPERKESSANRGGSSPKVSTQNASRLPEGTKENSNVPQRTRLEANRPSIPMTPERNLESEFANLRQSPPASAKRGNAEAKPSHVFTNTSKTPLREGSTSTKQSFSPHFFELPAEEEEEDEDEEETSVEYEVEEYEEETTETDSEEADTDRMNQFISDLMAEDPFFRAALEEKLSSKADVDLEEVMRRANYLHQQSYLQETSETSEEEEEMEEEEEEEEEEEAALPAVREESPLPDKKKSITEEFQTVINTFKERSQSRAEASQSPIAKEGEGKSGVVKFNDLETAHYYVCAALHGAEKIRGATAPLPPPLPLADKLQAAVARRLDVMKQDEELRSKDIPASDLENIKATHGKKLDDSLHQLLEDSKKALDLFTTVEERQALVEGKERLLMMRKDEFEDRCVAVETVRKEIENKRKSLAARNKHIQQREDKYRTLLIQHSEREKEIQQKVSEVEELGKKVSSWLRILEGREAHLIEKEERLQRLQADVVRRGDDVHLYHKNVKKIQPVSPPPTSNLP